MTWRIYYRDGVDASASFVEITDRIQADSWEVKEAAEEGTSPTSVLYINDPDMDITFEGLRSFKVIEDESESDDNILFYGYTGIQNVNRGRDENFEPHGRTWPLAVNDRNGYWQRIVMRGADCNRDEETDIQRVQWLIDTSEAATFDDTTSHVQSTGGVAMDAVDYRGQMVGQVMSDCAEAGGRNWWARIINDGVDDLMTMWYARDSRDTYDSLLALSNDPAALVEADITAGTALVWPVSEDTDPERDPTRLACGIYATYDGGATYRHNDDTHDAFGHRDIVMNFPNVKSKAKAQARADRMLDDLAEQDVRVTTTVRLPKSKGTMIRAGMRIPLTLTHTPDFATPKWCRVLSCSIKPAGAGEFYDLTLELTPTGPPDPGTEGGGEGHTAGGILYEPTDNGDAVGTEFQIYWRSSGDEPGLGYGYRYLDATNFDYTGSVPLVEGFEVLAATATLDLHCKVSMIDVPVGSSRTFRFSVRKNGVEIGFDEQTGGPGGFGTVFTVDISDEACVAGDLLTTWLTTSSSANPSVPLGTAATSEVFEILSTSTVVSA